MVDVIIDAKSIIPIAINASIDNKLALRKRPYSDANQSPSKVNVRLMVITDAMKIGRAHV
jgi:hypothetical protein